MSRYDFAASNAAGHTRLMPLFRLRIEAADLKSGERAAGLLGAQLEIEFAAFGDEVAFDVVAFFGFAGHAGRNWSRRARRCG